MAGCYEMPQFESKPTLLEKLSTKLSFIKSIFVCWRRIKTDKNREASKVCEDKPFRNIIDPKHNTKEYLEERLVSLDIAGLGEQLFDILVKAFATRLVSAGEAKRRGLQHVRGMLLYGPPGCGKTVLAKHFWQFIPAKEPLIITAYEVLGIRKGEGLRKAKSFIKKAIADEKKKGVKSDMYVVLFDGLLDYVARKNNTVKRKDDCEELLEILLRLMDGPDALNNIFVIATTDRKDLVDEAVLRQDRFGLHVKLDYPTEKQRLQILELSTEYYREHGLLDEDVNLHEIASKTNGSSAFISYLPHMAYSMLKLETGEMHVWISGDKIKMCHFDRVIEEERDNLYK